MMFKLRPKRCGGASQATRGIKLFQADGNMTETQFC